MTILTVTLNPAIDLETTTPEIVPGEKLRCTDPRRDPGGGGLNVARAITQLGGQAVALVAAQGSADAGLADMLARHGVPVEHLPAPGDVRQNLSVIETATGRQFRFIFPGPTWAAVDLEEVQAAILHRARPGDWLVLSGSWPPGIAPVAQVAMVRALAGQGVRVVADTSGPALEALAAARSGLEVLRMDQVESEALAGGRLPQLLDSADFAAGLARAGAARIVILARGAEGSILADRTGRWFAPAADVTVLSRTGAGDCFVAGAVLALSHGLSLPEVLSWGCAAASAAVTTPATELCEAHTMQALLPVCAAREV